MSAPTETDPAPPTLDDVRAAREEVSRHLPPTPLLHSPALSAMLGCEYYLKCENLQPVGAFKVRGGVHLLGRLAREGRTAGVVAASTGNHGQSLAFAGRLFGIPVVIYGPEVGANPRKVESMERMGAEVHLVGRDFDEAREACEEEAERSGLRYVHSANEPRLVAGVGTMALEILDELPDPEVVLVPVGGGSGASGNGLVFRALRPRAEVIGVQSEAAPAVHAAWKEGHLRPHPRMESRHEGLATRVPFRMTVEMLRELLADFVLVPEDGIDDAVRLLAMEARLVAEGAGAASTAAAFQLRERLQGKRVVGIVSGGNLPAEGLAEVLLGGR